MKCFVGALISDQTYDQRIENNSVGGLYQLNDYSHPIEKEFYIDKNLGLLRNILTQNDIEVTTKESCKFLSDLQCIHDEHSVEEWEQEFSDFASVHNLIYVPVTNNN